MKKLMDESKAETINVGSPEWLLLKDGWTVVTLDHSLSAQFEHTIAITNNGPELLSIL